MMQMEKIYASTEFAANELTELANEWLADSDEEEPKEITQEAFAKRIEISEVSVETDGRRYIIMTIYVLGIHY